MIRDGRDDQHATAPAADEQRDGGDGAATGCLRSPSWSAVGAADRPYEPAEAVDSLDTYRKLRIRGGLSGSSALRDRRQAGLSRRYGR